MLSSLAGDLDLDARRALTVTPGGHRGSLGGRLGALRRALRKGLQLVQEADADRLGPLLPALVDPVVECYGGAYTELRAQHDRIVSVLEGGYDLQGLRESVAAHVTALMGG